MNSVTAEVGAFESGVNQGGCGCPDLGLDWPGGVSVNHALRFIDMGNDTRIASEVYYVDLILIEVAL